MVSSSKCKPGIVALFAVGVVQQATALPQITSSAGQYHFGWLQVEGSSDKCEAVAAALNSLTYGSSSISSMKCSNSGDLDYLLVEGSFDKCEAVAAALNSLTYGSSSISGVKCVDISGGILATEEPKDLELLNTLLAFSVKGYSSVEVSMSQSTAAGLADVKSGMATTVADLADVKSGMATTAADLADVKSGMATTAADLADVKSGMTDLADVKLPRTSPT